MARRRRETGGGSFDSLLDTLANVVGILVLLLAVTQISVGSAVKRLASEPGQAPSPGEEEDARDALAAERAALARLRGELASLGRAGPGRSAPDPRVLAARRRRVEELERELGDQRLEVARVEVVLDEARAAAEAPEDRVVRLPDPRPPPAGARRLDYFCRYGRVQRVDVQRLLSILDRSWGEALDVPYPAPALTPDQTDRVVSHFATERPGQGPFQWRVSEIGVGRVEAFLSWKDREAGETGEELEQESSRFGRELAGQSPRRAYLHFLVWPDCFDTYLSARERAEDAGFAVGWRAFPGDGDPSPGPGIRPEVD